MDSAIYYPHGHIDNEEVMKEALLLWEHLHVIRPWHSSDPAHEGRIREAWTSKAAGCDDPFGLVMVPDLPQKLEAHDGIVRFLQNRDKLPPDFFLQPAQDGRREVEIYEIYPQKLLEETWMALEDAGFAGELLPNADRPTRPWAGLTIMAKLADACAGEQLACMTDRGDAYQAIAAQVRVDIAPPPVSDHVHWALHATLPKIDLSDVTIEDLLRIREDSTAAGLRASYRAQIVQLLGTLKEARGPNDVVGARRDFLEKMNRDLASLRSALRKDRIKTWLIAGGTSVLIPATAWAIQQNPNEIVDAVLLAGSTGVLAGVGIKTVGDMISTGFDLAARQEEKLTKHPMAYMNLIEHRLA